MFGDDGVDGPGDDDGVVCAVQLLLACVATKPATPVRSFMVRSSASVL